MLSMSALALMALLASAAAQIPSLGWCPDYQPMANFNINRFLGQWHEAERYFTVTEVGSRCVTTNYEMMPDGRVWVSNEIKSAFTGLKRVLDGTLSLVGREGEGKINIKYTSLPVPYDSQYSILDTDYDSYAVVWSCSGIGPVHTQNAWVMTRERLAPIATMQRAYGVLDRYKISRTFFVKTNQEDCSVIPLPVSSPQEEESREKKKGSGKHIEENVKSVESPKQDVDKKVDSDIPVKPQHIIPDVKIVAKSVPQVEKVISGSIVDELVVEQSKSAIPVPELILSKSALEERFDKEPIKLIQKSESLEQPIETKEEEIATKPLKDDLSNIRLKDEEPSEPFIAETNIKEDKYIKNDALNDIKEELEQAVAA